MYEGLGELQESEKEVAKKLIEEGWELIHKGVPDFIALRDGEIVFVEAKSKRDKLNPEQSRAFSLLKKHGYPVRVERVPYHRGEKRLRDFLSKHHITKEDKTTQDRTNQVNSRQDNARPRQTSPYKTTPFKPIQDQTLRPYPTMQGKSKQVHPIQGNSRPDPSTLPYNARQDKSNSSKPRQYQPIPRKTVPTHAEPYPTRSDIK